MARLSPVNQARWARFRHNRRGYWSLWIFLVLFALSLCAELVANDKPLLVRYDGSWYFPLVKNYSESDFGGPLATKADYQDPWLKQQLEHRGWILWAPVRFGANSINFATDTPSLRHRRRKTGWVQTLMAATCWRGSSTAPVSLFCLA